MSRFAIHFKGLNRREELQLALNGIHREAQRQDEHHRAEIRADVAHRWPAVAHFLQTVKVGAA